MARVPSSKADEAHSVPQVRLPGLFLLFAPGTRPVAAGLAAVVSGCTVSPRQSGPTEAMELMMAGQQFALLGLAPGPPLRMPAFAQAFDLALPAIARAEAIHLAPVSEQAGAITRAAIRHLVAIGSDLCQLPGLVALGWEAAGTVLSPAYFCQVGRGWLEGGAFPALGLVGLRAAGAGARETPGLHSTGLALFTGFELTVSARAAKSPAEAAKLAVRAMHGLVEEGCDPAELAEWLGEPGLALAWSCDGQTLSIDRP